MSRTVHRPSASAIERSLACELSAVLKRAPEAPRAHNSPSKKGDRGHKALERYAMGARWADVEHVVLPWDFYNLKEICEKMPKLEPIADFPFVEAEFWLNLDTGEAKLGTAEVPVEAGFWRGRADQIGWYQHPEHGRIPCVVDHKTGSPKWQIDGGAAQLGYFAVALHILMEAPYVYSIAYLTQEPDAHRGYLWTPEALTEQFRTMRNHELRLQVLEQNDVMPEPVEGKWCTFCPAKPICPLWVARKAEKDAIP